MLVLMCLIGAERLAIPVTQVVEVVPRVELHVPAEASRWVAGYFVYRGRPTPVLNWTANSIEQAHRLSQRIVMLSVSANGRDEVVGFIVDEATTQSLDDAEVQKAVRDASVKSRWGSILLDERGMFQFVDWQKLVTEEMLQEVFSTTRNS